jgi:hypothetical protein
MANSTYTYVVTVPSDIAFNASSGIPGEVTLPGTTKPVNFTASITKTSGISAPVSFIASFAVPPTLSPSLALITFYAGPDYNRATPLLLPLSRAILEQRPAAAYPPRVPTPPRLRPRRYHGYHRQLLPQRQLRLFQELPRHLPRMDT